MTKNIFSLQLKENFKNQKYNGYVLRKNVLIVLFKLLVTYEMKSCY